jgi:putative cell wall-binding protein
LKRSSRWMSIVLTICLAAWLIVPEVAAKEPNDRKQTKNAEGLQAKQQWVKQLLTKELKQQPRIKSSHASSNGDQTMTEMLYSGSIDNYTIKNYFFSTTGGKVRIANLIWGDDASSCFVINAAETDAYRDGEVLPAGDYYFSIFGFADGGESIPYGYKISGIPIMQASTELPHYVIKQPAKHEVNLPKNTSSLQVELSNWDALSFYGRDEVSHEVARGENCSFQIEGDFSVGLNFLIFKGMHENGNQLWSIYYIVRPNKRLSGADRYEVAVNVYRELYPLLDPMKIVLANGNAFADALVGGYLAYGIGIDPLLLTTPNQLPPVVKSVIQENPPQEVTIIGGIDSVSAHVETELKELGVKEINRITGADRYEISAKVADLSPTAGGGQDTALIVSGEDAAFGDALAVSSQAAGKQLPILLVQSNHLPESIQNYLKKHREIKHFLIVGGTDHVSDAVKSSLQSLRPRGKINRIAGANPFEIAVNVAKYFEEEWYDSYYFGSICFANGLDFPDALSTVPLAASMGGAPILLVQPDQVDTVVQDYLASMQGQFRFMYLSGGTGAVSEMVEQQLLDYIVE